MDVYRNIENRAGLQPPIAVQRHAPVGVLRAMAATSGLGEEPPADLAQTAQHASGFKGEGRLFVEKIWTELAYESVRRKKAANAPSRFRCIWAFLDPFEAFSFTEHTAQPYMVCRARIPEGFRGRSTTSRNSR